MPVFTKSSRLSPHHRLVIALHSLSALPETGLRMCHPEKGRQIDAIRPRVVRSLQSALRTKYHEIRACFAYFAEKGGAVSLQFRLAGGEGGIRTLGTGISQYNGLAILYSDTTPSVPNYLQSHSSTKTHPM
jgi:hypothetical protein